jgi:hypothetical protein
MRYNIFNKAHLPLKTALISGCIAITGAVDGQAPATDALLKVGEALGVFNEQVGYEMLHVLPFVFEYEPSVSATYASEHEKTARIARRLRALLHAYGQKQAPGDKMATLQSILNEYNEFVLVNFNHMDDEEAVVNEILWRYYPDTLLLQLEEKIDILPHLQQQQQQKNRFQIATAA